MDKTNKTLLKIPRNQRRLIVEKTRQILQGKVKGLDLKRLKGSKELFRVRSGDYRIIVKIQANKTPLIVAVIKRDEKTYKNI